MPLAEGSSTSHLKHGAEVKDSEGKHLGTVSEVEQEYFKVNVHMARDYWLPIDVLASHEGDVIELRLPEHELSSHKQYSGIEHLPKEELEGSMRLDAGAEAARLRDEAQSDFLEQT